MTLTGSDLWHALGAAAMCLGPSFLILLNADLDGPMPLRATSPALAHHVLPQIEARLAPIGPDDDDRVGEGIRRSTAESQRGHSARPSQGMQEMTTTLTLSLAPHETALSISRSAAASTG